MSEEILYSYQDDIFTTEGIDEVYQTAFSQELIEVGGTLEIYSANFVKRNASYYFPCGNRLVEEAIDSAYDVVGEFGDDWFNNLDKKDNIKKLEDRFSKLVNEWAKELNLEPSFMECLSRNPSIFVKAISEDEYEVMQQPPVPLKGVSNE